MLDRAYARVGWIAACVVMVLAMFMTGHLGGNLTHGETYLVEYAPTPLRQLAGLSAEAGPREKPADIASADIYPRRGGPGPPAALRLLPQRRQEERRAEPGQPRRLDEGRPGRAGRRPGRPRQERPVPPHHPARASTKTTCPADGKTPLTEQQVAAIGWWISQGAPATAKIATLKVTPEVQPALAAVLGGLPAGSLQLASGPAPAAAAGAPPVAGATPAAPVKVALPEEPLPTVPLADQKVVSTIVSRGFIARPVQKESNLLDLDYTVRTPISNETLAELVKIAPQILRLNLRNAGLTDAQAQTLARFPNLRVLRLEGNPITDAALGPITGLKSLTYLNLVNTKVTDSGIAQLEALPRLSRLYVWGTGVTEAATQQLQADRNHLLLVAGVKPEDIPALEPLRQPQN